MKLLVHCGISGSLIVCAVLLLFGCEMNFHSSSHGSSPKVYEVGDAGPAGGIIFYDKGFYSYNWRYLEAAPQGWYTGGDDPDFEWGLLPFLVGETDTAIGTGKANTEKIVFELVSGTYAAKECYDLILGLTIEGYKDWFLPSRDELNLLYENLHQQELGGLSNWHYWSSSEFNDGQAWSQRFIDGEQFSSRKDNEYLVRPIRSL